MKDLLLLLLVGVLVLENALSSDIEIAVIRMDVADDLRTDGLVDLGTSDDIKLVENSMSRANLISSSLDDDLDAKVHNALRNMQKEDKNVSKVFRCCCHENKLVYLHHLHNFLKNHTDTLCQEAWSKNAPQRT
ncbi:hypothetical protein B9Z55_007572 [Caenorhabditis nigoni]|uniref:Uncharacterized protein n=1 Tax=Caenorhabditis nigoni TaxID=1611254 RepID=A0A2G5VAA5_9PELO|nr:hypothetical protein B9Z55_007572 [Caenorhabditis nigoni]